MYKIQPIEQRIIAKELYPSLNEDELLFALNEGGGFKGFGVCAVTGECVTVKKIDVPYEDARYIMLLAMLSYAERRGVKKAMCEDTGLRDLCEKAGFSKDLTVSLEGFFAPGKRCDKKI